MTYLEIFGRWVPQCVQNTFQLQCRVFPDIATLKEDTVLRVKRLITSPYIIKASGFGSKLGDRMGSFVTVTVSGTHKPYPYGRPECRCHNHRVRND